jgi:hypothetical protein
MQIPCQLHAVRIARRGASAAQKARADSRKGRRAAAARAAIGAVAWHEPCNCFALNFNREKGD